MLAEKKQTERRPSLKHPTAYVPNPSPCAWNCWYADADFANGYTLAIAYFFGLMRPPGDATRRFIDYLVFDPEGNRYHMTPRFSPAECKASEQRCDVLMRNNFYREQGSGYHVYFYEGDLGCDLFYEPVIGGYQADLSALPGVRETYNWYMTAIKAKVAGKITMQGRTMDVSGYGYQDHSWDCEPMGLPGTENVFWGKIYQGDWSLLWQTGSLFVGKGNKMILESTKGSTHPFDFTTKDTRVERPQLIVFKADDPGRAEGEIRFKVVEPLDYDDLLPRRFKPFQRWFTKAYFGQPAYFRYRLEYDMNLRILGEKVTGKGVSWCEHHKIPT